MKKSNCDFCKRSPATNYFVHVKRISWITDPNFKLSTPELLEDLKYKSCETHQLNGCARGLAMKVVYADRVSKTMFNSIKQDK